MDLQTMIDELDAELGRSGGKKKAALPRIPQHVMDAAARPFPASPGVQEQAFDAMRTPIEGASYLARGATRLMTDPLGAARDALGTAWDATGIPMMAEGVQQAYRGATEGNALLAAGGAGKTVLGALPGASLVRGARPVVNALAGSVPRAVLTLGGLGALSGAADAGEAARAQQPPDLLPSLMEDRARIQQELQRYTAIKGQNASRPGPKYREAERQIMMLEPKLQAIDAQIQEEQRKRSPEYKMELQAKQAKQPFLERYPELSGALPFISMAAAVGLPAFLKASKNALSWNAGPAARLSRSTKTAEREIAAMVPGQPAAPSAELAVSKLGERLIESEKFIPRATEASGKVFGPIVLPALGGAAGAEVAMLPDVADWMTLPPGPERDAAQARALDMATFAKRAAVGAIMGKGGYEIGARIPARTMDPAAARGVLAVGNKQLGTSYGPTRVAPPTGAGNAPPPAPPAGPPPPNYGTPGAPYPLAGSPEREQIRQAYLIEMQRRGGAVPPTQFDQALRAEPAFAGIPKTQKRVAETNKLVAAFVQTYGRLPTASPADQREIFRMARTLAVPAAVGVNALVGASRQPEE